MLCWCDREWAQQKIRILEQNIWSYDSAQFQEKWLFQEGKPNKQFLHLEDLKLSKKEIDGLQLDQGRTVTDTNAILDVIHNFYQELYSAVIS